MDTLMYKTPSPVTAKRRLSGIPVTSRANVKRSTDSRVVSEQMQRIHREWPDLEVDRVRRGSIGSTGNFLRTLKDESDSVDSSMGFRELERHIAKVKRQNFDLKLELHIRREKMTANADKLHQAERLIQENEELQESLKEARVALKARNDELKDCKALIRLLSDQLESSHKRIASLTTASRSGHTSDSPTSSSERASSHSERLARRKTPILQSSEFDNLSPAGSPGSLVSLESSIGSQSDDEENGSDDIGVHEETVINLKEPTESMRKIHIPRTLEHSPKTTRRQSMLEQISPPLQARTPLYSDRRLSYLSSNRTSRMFSPESQTQASRRVDSRLVTPAVSRVTTAFPTRNLPPTPDDTPIPVKPATRRPVTLRGRIFRSKSDFHDNDPDEPKEPTPKTVVKKNSLIRFWKAKTTPPSKPSESKKTPAKEVLTNFPPTPDKTPKVALHDSTNITMPHESDQLSRYPKIRPVSLATTRSTAATPGTNAEWRQSIGRQVTEMVQHWEEETSRRSDTVISCANYISSKRLSSTNLTDGAASPLAVKAARDAWTSKVNAPAAKPESVASRERGERIDKLRRQRDELVKKLGLSTVPPNAAAA